MDLGVEKRDGVTIVNLPRIPLDTSFVSEFTHDMASLLVAQPRVVIDLRKLLFIDSSGVGALVNALSTAKNAGGDIKLANIPPQVKGVFEVVRLDKLFSAYPGVDEAVAAFKG